MHPYPLKSLGQHFLTDETITDRIVNAADVVGSDLIWEIGPGRGILTQSILKKSENLTVFELDRRLREHLEGEFGTKIRIVMKDILRINWEEELPLGGQVKLISNIPYQITSPLLYKVERFASYFECLVLMVQKEVAERLTAYPSTREYGPLTLKIKYHFDTELLFIVDRVNFDPVPKVDSAVIKLSPRSELPRVRSLQTYWNVINKAFEHRRKTLKNNLKPLISVDQIALLEKNTGIDLSRRGETLSEDEFILLSDTISDLG